MSVYQGYNSYDPGQAGYTDGVCNTLFPLAGHSGGVGSLTDSGLRLQPATLTMSGGAGASTAMTGKTLESVIIEVTVTADGQQLILSNLNGLVYFVRVVAGGFSTFFIRRSPGGGGVTVVPGAPNQWVYFSPTTGDVNKLVAAF